MISPLDRERNFKNLERSGFIATIRISPATAGIGGTDSAKFPECVINPVFCNQKLPIKINPIARIKARKVNPDVRLISDSLSMLFRELKLFIKNMILCGGIGNSVPLVSAIPLKYLLDFVVLLCYNLKNNYFLYHIL